MTYGQLKFRLTKAFPGVDADLIEGWITDCYQEILGLLPWSRLDVQAILYTTAPYITGMVSVTQGSAALTLTGGTWNSGMSTLSFRVAGDSGEYTFTYVSATTGTLDRPYTGNPNAAAAYSIYQAIYQLPANCRFVDDEAFNTFEAGPMRRLQTEEGQTALLAGGQVATPAVWWPQMDSGSTPPQMQVRFYPIPDKVYGIPFTYGAESANPSGTSSTMLPWVQPAALIEGSTDKIKRHLKDYAGAQAAKAAFGDAMAVMISQEAYRRGPVRVQLDPYYTRHRGLRGR